VEIKEVKDAIVEGIKPLNDSIGAVKTGVDAMDVRLKKIEAIPFEKFTAPAIIPSSKFLGYDLNRQGQLIKERTVGKAEFSSFTKEENVNNFAKWMLATILSKGKNPSAEAKQALAEIHKSSLAEGAAGTGGDLVPDEYQWDMVALARSKSYFLQLASVVPMTSDVMYLPTEATLATMHWHSEAATMSQSDPTFSHITLTAKKATCYGIASNELLQDSRVDITSILTEQFAYGIGLDIDNQALNGTGVPTSGLLCSGVLTTNVVILAGSMSTITPAKLSMAIYKLNESDLANARFMFCRLAMHYIRSLTDTYGQLVMQPLSMGIPSAIYGFPYVMSENISNTETTASPVGIFGDFKKYYIGRRIGAMALEVDPYGAFASDETRFRMISRWGFAVGRQSALCKIITL
jgi:HK97 family phage major capsid protein